MEKNKTFLAEHPVRKNKRQKTDFVQHLCSVAASNGYVSEIEQSKSGSRNVVVGNFVDADVVYTAHYDTPARSIIPTFVTPKIPILSKLSQLLVALLVLAPAFAAFFLLSELMPNYGFEPAVAVIIAIASAVAVFFILMFLFVCGPARRHNANSNTSGVFTLLEIMDAMPSELRRKVAFVFLDNQENGYIGASEFSKKHKHILEKKLIVNFDAVGVGENVVIATSVSDEYVSAVTSAFESCGGIKTEIVQGGKHIPSDHIKFKNAIGVSAFKKGLAGILYIDKLTTGGDVECSDANIEYMTKSAVKLATNVFDR